jgi:hypothetical protein
MEQIADTADIDRHGPETMRKILALVDRAKKWEQAKVEGRK